LGVTADPLATVRAALEAADRDPRGPAYDFTARCPCPGHGRGRGDRSPSLSVREGADQRALVYCRVGCATEDVVAALGLTMRDLFPPDPLDGPNWPKALQDRYVAIAGRVSQAKVDAYRRRRRLRDADVLLDVVAQLARTGSEFSASVAFTCPCCQAGHAWVRRDHAGLTVDCDQGCGEDDVLGALAEGEKAA
jgi:hypothetical protein